MGIDNDFRIRSVTLLLFALINLTILDAQQLLPDKGRKVEFIVKEAEQKIVILIGGKIITSYLWPDNVYKPILYPVLTTNGTEITRGFPLRPRAGERDDHIHQVGMWLNYGNVNGIDFWGNGSTGKKNPEGGVIKHQGINKVINGDGEGLLAVTASWQDPSGKEILNEETEFHFLAFADYYCIDRVTKLTAKDIPVRMPDTKEGMFAIRVARQLEHPSNENVVLLDSTGKPGIEKANANRGVSGNYRSSLGITGDAVWGTRARWMDLYGNIGNEKISVIILDHPSNPSYPTYWHARGYGLFSANPLGGRDFSGGKEDVNFSIEAGKTAIFRYRTIVTSGFYMTDKMIDDLASDFAERYK